MSIEATRYVWNNSQAKGTDRLVLLAIADMADDYGDAFPGITRISIKCMLSERSTQESIKTLEYLGELEVFQNCGYKTSHGRTNLYRVVMDGVDQNEVIGDDGKRAYPRVEGVRKTASQEVNPSAPLGVNPSAPKPPVEPSVYKIPSASRTRDRSYMGIDLNRPEPVVINNDPSIVLESKLVKYVMSQTTMSGILSKNLQKVLSTGRSVDTGVTTIWYPPVIEMYDKVPAFKEFVIERVKAFNALPSPSRPQDILVNISRVGTPPVDELSVRHWPGYHYWLKDRQVVADGQPTVIDGGVPDEI